MVDNRRRCSRILFDGKTLFCQGDNQWQATLIDLSLKGLLIEQPKNWQNANTSEPMEARIRLNSDTAITMTVRWRHTGNGRVGFECEHIDLDSITHLRRLVELNLGNEELLARELATLDQ